VKHGRINSDKTHSRGASAIWLNMKTEGFRLIATSSVYIPNAIVNGCWFRTSQSKAYAKIISPRIRLF